MSLVDSFICRREGHIPSVTLTNTKGITVTSYLTSCLRCRKWYVVKQAATNDGEDEPPTIGKVS